MAYAVKTTIVIPNTIVKFTALRVVLQFYVPHESVYNQLSKGCARRTDQGFIGVVGGYWVEHDSLPAMKFRSIFCVVESGMYPHHQFSFNCT